mmetsp:Transcript_4671/g.8908  ORF Transcript_4671/g.8908 Transcript_4671/m.8908 type:complete len:737 (-) Transcript_4671:14-2224(-)|eukprot:scaffold4724_cov166-Amphora_coffeaeformis.AAC.2
MNLFRRRDTPTDNDDDAGPGVPSEENPGNTNYLSFQDRGENERSQEGDVLREPGRRWWGGRRGATGEVAASPHSHRGFSTSIHDMFQSPETERVDCCALTCCGMLQSDRDRYFLQGVLPPSLIRRLWLHILFPVFIFSIAGFAAFRIPDARINELFTTGTLFLFIFYLILQCLKGRAKRIEIRKDLLWTKAQLLDQRRQNLSVILEQERPDDHGKDQEYYLGQKRSDFKAAHPFLCGCYVEDRLVQHDNDSDSDEQKSVCTSIWEWACPPCCGMHMQCCGVCALAQEGREVETALLPRSYLRVDYITMQPYADYYPAIYQDRHQSNTDEQNGDQPSSRSARISRLSKQLLQVLATLVFLLILWIFAGKIFFKRVIQGNVPAWRLFQWADMMVFCATWFHAVGLLMLLIWVINRFKHSEVSLDALIKYFAAGFCLSTSLAVFWEVVLGIIVKMLVSLVLALSGVDITSRPDAQQTYLHSMGQAVSDDGTSAFLQTFGKDHPIFYTLYLLVASFVIAAFVEEMCKYFGYRMVEHPDFLSRREMEDAMNVVHGEFEEEDPDQSHPERHDFSKQRRSFQGHGAAVTVAMIAVAMGFTCCENLVYVFIYSGSSLETELSVLLARSFFPVHPLAAALQSIGVVERDVEGRRISHLGRIIGPAILFHGGYDFWLLWIDFMADKNGIYAKDDDSIATLPILFSFCASVVMIAGALWYFMRAARQQRDRLSAMDRDDAAVRSSLI